MVDFEEMGKAIANATAGRQGHWDERDHHPECSFDFFDCCWHCECDALDDRDRYRDIAMLLCRSNIELITNTSAIFTKPNK